MKSFHIALLQLLPEKSIEENLKKGLDACRKAKLAGADLALFPEMWSTGYNIPENIEELKAISIPEDCEFIRAFQDAARELEMAVGITFLEAHEPLPRNSLCLFDRFGNKVFTYAKVHTCDFGEECRLSAGDDFYVADLDTGAECLHRRRARPSRRSSRRGSSGSGRCETVPYRKSASGFSF